MYVLCGGSVVTLNERQTKVKVDVLSNFCTSNLQHAKSSKNFQNDTAESTVFF